MADKKQNQDLETNAQQSKTNESSPQAAATTSTGNTTNMTGNQSAQSTAAPQMQRAQSSGGGSGQSGLTRRGGLFAPSLFAPSLFSMSPFQLMRQFTDEMDRMFEDFGMSSTPSSSLLRGGSGGGGSSSSMTQSTPNALQTGFGGASFTPQVEVFEREGNLVVRADLPGMSKDDVRVEVDEDVLTIEGERHFEHQENQGGVIRSERSYGTFRRQVPLPQGINAENANASFQNGVLEITMQLPQAQSSRRRLEIQDSQNANTQTGTKPTVEAANTSSENQNTANDNTRSQAASS